MSSVKSNVRESLRTVVVSTCCMLWCGSHVATWWNTCELTSVPICYTKTYGCSHGRDYRHIARGVALSEHLTPTKCNNKYLFDLRFPQR